MIAEAKRNLKIAVADDSEQIRNIYEKIVVILGYPLHSFSRMAIHF